jgi:hypothetical protein
MLHIDLSRLNEAFAERCEQIFQRKMDESGGKRCIITSTMFDGIDLTSKSVDAQIVLNLFANMSCPLSCFRFAASLYPYQYPAWPVVSSELSHAYMFEAIEVALNLGYDKKAVMILNEFQSTQEFLSIMQIANEMLQRVSFASAVCSEVVEFIEQYKAVKHCNDRGYWQ